MRRSFSRWLLALVVTATLCVYLAGNQAIGLFDRDEPRYAQTSRQMLASGDWVVPRFLDKVRTAKPAGIYWCQAAAMRWFGDTRFAARLPSSLAMAATVGLLAVAVGRGAGRRRGLWTAFVLGTCVMAIVSAKMCLTDAVLLLLLTTSQLCLYRLWRRGPDAATVATLGLSAGLAALTKGPVALGVNATTLLALWGLGATLRPRTTPSATRFRNRHIVPTVLGVAAMLAAVVTPWLVLIHKRAPEFLSTAVGHDVIDRMQRGAEGHAAPPGFYSLIVWGTFFPWSLLLPAALAWGWKRRHVPAVRFAFAAWAGPWVMFELIATKLPHYVLPTYPALAFLTADLLARAARGRVKEVATRSFRVAVWAWAALIVSLGFGVPAAVWWTGQADPPVVLGAIGIAGVVGLGGFLTARRFSAGRTSAAARAMGGGTLIAVTVLATLVLPKLRVLRLTRDVAAVINDHGGYAAPGMMIDFKEPSLAFEQGGGLREQSDNDYLNTAAPADRPQWAVVTRRVWDGVRADVREQWTEIGSAVGVAYSARGERLEVVVLRRRAG